jgi:TRAP transporter TAXI family solute receptor
MAFRISSPFSWLRDALGSAAPLLLITLALLVAAYQWLEPNPPRTVRLATGPEQSAYDRFGGRYAQALARDGIRVQLVPTEGSADNLLRLRRGEVDVAFVQGGFVRSADTAEADTQLLSLGNLFVEPVWLFHRSTPASANAQPISQLKHLAGARLNIGTPGSGVPELWAQLLTLNQLEPSAFVTTELAPTPATVAFINGEVDALLFVSAPEAPLVQMLLQTPGVRLLSFEQSEAYARRLPFLSPALLPQGVVNLASNLPEHDVRLIATTTSLVARDATHPALQQLFAQAARELHGEAGWFSRAREFPNATHADFDVSVEAERTLRNGPPFLQRYLPFWLANLIERMWLAGGLIIALVLPLSRIVPPLYTLRMRSKVFRWYAELRDIESRAQQGEPVETLVRDLRSLTETVNAIEVPLSFADELYALRHNIAAVSRHVQGDTGTVTAGAATPNATAR